MPRSFVSALSRSRSVSAFLLCFLLASQPTLANADEPKPIRVSTAGNSWVDGDAKETRKVITNQGVRNWSLPTDEIVTYVRLPRSGVLHAGLKGRAPSGRSVLEITIESIESTDKNGAAAGGKKTITLTNTEPEDVTVGTFPIGKAGHIGIRLKGLSKTGPVFADITEITLGGSAAEERAGASSPNDRTYFIDDATDGRFYWSRRGPSVHLNYKRPAGDFSAEWLYSEMMIPVGQDPIGSYFMANGFGEGYFGIQVNSATERRILFSVWSPFKTDDPKAVPADNRVKLLRKGDGVIARDFGNEGSGGQSYKRYAWSSGRIYRFLLRAQPDAQNNTTDYTAYFSASPDAPWELIAAFRRPKTTTWLTHHHAFVENFLPEYGRLSRQALYRNIRIRNSAGQWTALGQAGFSFDDTARRKQRWDYQGEVQDGWFSLKNGGFLDAFTKPGRVLKQPSSPEPTIAWDKLP